MLTVHRSRRALFGVSAAACLVSFTVVAMLALGTRVDLVMKAAGIQPPSDTRKTGISEYIKKQ